MLYECPNAEQIKETYNQYIKAFQSGEWEKVREYVANNVYFYWGTSCPPLVGKDAFIDFFSTAAKYWKEKPVPENIDVTVPVLRAWINNTIEVHTDWENSPFEVFGMQPKAGDTYNPQGYVNYVFNEDGQIAIIIDCDYAH